MILENEKYMQIWHHFRKIQVFVLESEVKKMQKMKFFRHFAPPVRCYGNKNLGSNGIFQKTIALGTLWPSCIFVTLIMLK